MVEPWRIRGTAVVTGGARGVGLAIARRLAERGADVTIADIDARAAREAADHLCGRNLSATSLAVDVSDEASVDRLAETALQAGPLVAWVNNAGVNSLCSLTELTLEAFERILRVNVVGCFLGTRAAARSMSGGGAIVNVSSVSARRAYRDNSHYGATKGAIESFSRHAAVDLAPKGIRVNCVAPGSVRTDMTAERYAEPGVLAARKARIPLGRVATPDEIAGAAAFLCSEEAAYVTGETLVVDGGWSVA